MQLRKELGRQRIIALDGARGILALSVFFLHAVTFYQYEKYGQWLPPASNFYSQLAVFPVSMFFFITGYVFWLKLIAQPRIPFWQFLYGRLGRLGIVYGFVCILCFALAAVVSGFHRTVSIPMLAAQCAGWLSFFGSGHDINRIYFSRLWLGPGWTLKFEWMFYCSLPLLGWFARSWQRLPLILGLAAVVSFTGDHLHVKGPVHLLWEMAGSYAKFLAYTFSVGMIVATIRASSKMHAWARSGLAAGLSLALIAATVTWAVPEFGWRESLLLAVPFACVCMGNTWFGLLTSEPVRFLGRVSYSFYLLHVVLLASEILVLRKYVDFGSIDPARYWLFAATSGAITICLSAFSYQYLEYPLLHIGRSARSRDQRVMSQPVRESFGTIAEPIA
jgi:peptidoglycan/LPS O-acetylase OafA/YrhL